MPTCFGEARKVVLKHLGNRYGRTFANHWQFVRFAQEQQLNLDDGGLYPAANAAGSPYWSEPAALAAGWRANYPSLAF